MYSYQSSNHMTMMQHISCQLASDQLFQYSTTMWCQSSTTDYICPVFGHLTIIVMSQLTCNVVNGL